MKKFDLLNVDQSFYYEKLDCGLQVFLFPYPNKKNYYVNYTTRYGSINVNFVPFGEKKTIKTHYGIAHFLEHKMFEQEDGVDPFTFFTKTGTGCNAGTSFKRTSYYIYGVNKLKSNLEYLINYVNSPYFTDENVEKEKGIIIEEIKMYDDNPDWILMEEMQKGTFINHPIRYDIAGYVDSVNAITKEELYKCYNTFYHPSNMCLVIAGNFNYKEVLDVIKNNTLLKEKKEQPRIKIPKEKEPFEVNEKEKSIYCDSITVPKVGLSIKLSLDKVKDRYVYFMYISIILKILFGSSSSFKEEMLKKKLATSLETDVMTVEDYLLIQLYIESDKPKELVDKILEQFKCYIISEDELERIKKVQIASEVMATDNIEIMVENTIDDFVNWDKVIVDKVDIIKKLNIMELNKIQNELKIDNNSIIILNNKKQ